MRPCFLSRLCLYGLLVLCATAHGAFASSAPLTLVLQKQKDPDALKSAAEHIAQALEKELDRPVRVLIPGDYAATVQALIHQRADAGYLSSIPFLLARRDGGARLLLAEARPDQQGVARTRYEAVWVVRKDSPYRTLEEALAHSKTLRMAFTSSTSTSGYVFPLNDLIARGVLKKSEDPRQIFRSVAYAGGYTQALEQLLQGRADLAAVSGYTMEGSSAAIYLDDTQRAKLRILERIPNVPTHLIAVGGELDAATADALKQALLKVSKRERALFSQVYGAEALVEVEEDAHVAPTVDAITRTGLPIHILAR